LTGAAADTLLRTEALAVARGGVPLLQDVDLDLRAGQAIILRGPNGAGKTTLLRVLAGLQPPLRGQVHADEDDIAYAAHLDGVKATLSVQENLQFWAHVFCTSLDGVFEKLDLQGLEHRAAGTLSAGQKRRLGLARMLVTGRRIWIMDEPTVSLDAASVGLFETMVQAHLQNGGATIMATHIDFDVDGTQVDLGAYRASPALVDAEAAFL
jgi:heme exporter protein A